MEFCRKSTFRSALSALISNGEDRSKDNRKRYKSEYKKKFRPFSQYVYEASKGTFTKCRGKGKVDEASERMLKEPEVARGRQRRRRRRPRGRGGAGERRATTAPPRCARPACSRSAWPRATPGTAKSWTCASAPASTRSAPAQGDV